MSRRGWVELYRYAAEELAEDGADALHAAGIPADVVHAPNGTDAWALLVAPEDRERALFVLVRGELPPEAPSRGVQRYMPLAGIVLVDALLFVALERAGGSTNTEVLHRFGAASSAALARGEWHRLIAAVFLHIGPTHLAANMVTLAVLGIVALRALGTGRFLALYILSGIGGNLLSWAVPGSAGMHAGASGAILGLLGALVGSRLRSVRLFPPRSRFRSWHIVAAGIVLYMWIAGTGAADHVAHIGGALAGFALAFVLPKPGELAPEMEQRLDRGLTLFSLAVAVGGVLGVVASS